MLIYFDESYDKDRNWLILGATFHPHPKFLHKKIKEIKKKYNFITSKGEFKELKYSKCTNEKTLLVAKEIVDAFWESTSYFRAIVIPQGANWFDINAFGKDNEDNKIKFARIYKKFTELLILHNTSNIYNAVLLTDELTRPKSDKFFSLLKESFCISGKGYCEDKKEPILKEILSVKSDLEQYNLL